MHVGRPLQVSHPITPDNRNGVSPMVPHTTRILFPHDFPDRWLTEAVVRLSSSPWAREAAGAWLAAYHAARARGAAEPEARRQADAAYHQVVARPGVPPTQEAQERRAA